MEMQLSAAGAVLLRAARDQILAHPDTFDMAEWDCGTTACIGGWMKRFAGVYSSVKLSEVCGFGYQPIEEGHPLFNLFYGIHMTFAPSNRFIAAWRINRVLKRYGYPADVTDVQANRRAVDAWILMPERATGGH